MLCGSKKRQSELPPPIKKTRAGRQKACAPDDQTLSDKLATAISDDLLGLVGRYPDRNAETRYSKELAVVVVPRESALRRLAARCFQRSCAAESGAHGTFKDGERPLPMSPRWALTFCICRRFPIHPIGYTHRKGEKQFGFGWLHGNEMAPGSPWAIPVPPGEEWSPSRSSRSQDSRRFQKIRRKARDSWPRSRFGSAPPSSAAPDHP